MHSTQQLVLIAVLVVLVVQISGCRRDPTFPAPSFGSVWESVRNFISTPLLGCLALPYVRDSDIRIALPVPRNQIDTMLSIDYLQFCSLHFLSTRIYVSVIVEI